MSGSPLKVLVGHRPPLAFINAANTTHPIFTGFLVDLLPTLLQQANVQATYDLYAYQVSHCQLIVCCVYLMLNGLRRRPSAAAAWPN